MHPRPENAETRDDALHHTLFRVFEILASPGDMQSQLALIHWELHAIVDASNLYVALYDAASGLYYFPYNADQDDKDFAPQELRKSLTDYVRRTARPLLCAEDTHQRLCASGEVVAVGVPCAVWLGAPLLTGQGCIGALVVQSYVDPTAYTEADVATLELIARAMAVVLQRHQNEERRRVEQEMRLNELRLSRDEALRATQEKSRFLANMSHELRTPLNAILGYTDLLLEDLAGASLERDLGAIRASALHLRKLIDGLLDLTQIESGRLEVTVTTFSVTELFGDLHQQVAPLLVAHANDFVRVGDAAAGSLVTDRRMLFQALLNLVGNACKFTHAGRIALRVRCAQGRATFEVSDTGVGIDPAVLPGLFEPFAQVDSSSTRAQGGSGLGLGIARRLVERLGGTLNGASVPGRGTTFTLEIPTVLAGSAPDG